jgi:hypothetical protein
MNVPTPRECHCLPNPCANSANDSVVSFFLRNLCMWGWTQECNVLQAIHMPIAAKAVNIRPAATIAGILFIVVTSFFISRGVTGTIFECR